VPRFIIWRKPYSWRVEEKGSGKEGTEERELERRRPGEARGRRMGASELYRYSLEARDRSEREALGVLACWRAMGGAISRRRWIENEADL